MLVFEHGRIPTFSRGCQGHRPIPTQLDEDAIGHGVWCLRKSCLHDPAAEPNPWIECRVTKAVKQPVLPGIRAEVLRLEVQRGA